MRGAVEGRAAASAVTAGAGARRPTVSLFPPAAVAIGAGAVLAGGGSSAGPLVWIGGAATVVAGAGLAAAFVRPLPRPAPGIAGMALACLLVAFAAWSAATIAWSVDPDRSWESVNRVLAYLGLLLLGMVAGAASRSATRAAAALSGVLGVAIAWSLAGKVVPALGPDTDRSARLTGPLDYWNALALAVAVSVPLWLWLASSPKHRPWIRAAAVAAASWSVVALLLTGSRGGLVVATVAVAFWIALAPSRLESASALAVALPLGGAVGAWALSRPGLAEAGAEAGTQAADGALLGVLLAATAATAAAVTLAALRMERRAPLSPSRRRSLGRLAAALAALALVAAPAAALVAAGGPAEALDAFRNPPEQQVTNDPRARLGDPSSNHRWTWWRQAWEIFGDHRVGGAGAGAFELARRPIRQDTRAPLDPHSIALKALSETGAVGLVLVLGLLGAGACVLVAALRRLDGPDRAAAAALTAGAAAWLAHALVDMTWEHVAVTGPLFLVLGALAVTARPPTAPARRSVLAALASVLLAGAVVASLASPWAAERRIDAALAELESGRVAAAVDLARDARALNPLSVQPLHVEAAAFEAAGRTGEAERLYRRAARLAPANPVTWYELGRFEYETRENLETALVYLDRAWGLDRWAPETGRLLDAVRADLAEGAG